jgi:hypothetical protein
LDWTGLDRIGSGLDGTGDIQNRRGLTNYLGMQVGRYPALLAIMLVCMYECVYMCVISFVWVSSTGRREAFFGSTSVWQDDYRTSAVRTFFSPTNGPGATAPTYDIYST